MTKFFRADGLVLEDMPLVVLKQTNLPFIGATWAEYDGIVWHLSDEAMYTRATHPMHLYPYRGTCYELKTCKIDLEEYYRLYFLLKVDANRYKKYKMLEKAKFLPFDHNGVHVGLKFTG
jgi:hypothetical protein